MAKEKSKKRPRLDKKCYEHHLAHLQEELVKLQEWVKQEGLKVVVLFEGRDAAGKGGVIKAITEPLNPRVCRVTALPSPPIGSAPSGTFSVMWPTCPPLAKWCCLTALVQPGRSRAGDGILQRCRVSRVSARLPRV